MSGLTVKEVQNGIQEKLDEFFKDATVFIKLVNFQIGVLGEVEVPGNYTIEQDQINIFQALGLARGLTSFGNVEEVKLIRQTQTGSDIHVLDLTNNSILGSPYFYLMPNDVIYIEARNSKSWVMETFPYQTLAYVLSIGILAVGVFK